MSQQLHVSVIEASQVAEARRLIGDLAGKLGFDDTETGKVAIVVTEAATNLVKHAGGGQILARPLKTANRLGLEILALDQGPGLANVAQALADGYSSTSTAGTGLGAIVRLSTVFDIYSLPGKGTAVLAHLYKRDGSRLPESVSQLWANGASSPWEIGAVCLAKPGQEVSGDNWAVVQGLDHCLLMVADGLGHGLEAAAASQAAVDVLLEKPAHTPAAVIEAAHAALFHTRGAAVAVAELDLVHLIVKFSGVGNIAGVILTMDTARHLASYNGIVGHQARKIQEFTYPWSNEAILVMHSDGLTTHWNLNAYPGLMARHPGLIAGVLYRDFSRGNDDVSVVVIKQT